LNGDWRTSGRGRAKVLQRDTGGGVEQNIEYEEDHPETDFQCFGNRLDFFNCAVNMHEKHQREDHEKNIEGITETGACGGLAQHRYFNDKDERTEATAEIDSQVFVFGDTQ
jgi:hypothetical protein